MNCRAVARSAREQTPDGLEWIGTQAELPRLLNESDEVAMTCDLNAETEGMIDAGRFCANEADSLSHQCCARRGDC